MGPIYYQCVTLLRLLMRDSSLSVFIFVEARYSLMSFIQSISFEAYGCNNVEYLEETEAVETWLEVFHKY